LNIINDVTVFLLTAKSTGPVSLLLSPTELALIWVLVLLRHWRSNTHSRSVTDQTHGYGVSCLMVRMCCRRPVSICGTACNSQWKW